jgi:DNA-binding XRE family transcriptional regulator
MEMFLASNIHLLRKRRKRTQDDVASSVNIKRSTYTGIEVGNSLPSIEVLIALSNYFTIAVDTLLKVDMQKLSSYQLSELEHGNGLFIRGANIRVISTTINTKGEENIELVHEKAKAGYALGYADPEYISELPTFHLPFLSKNKKYRSFQITGDSMLPIPEGSWITGEFVQDWHTIQSGKPLRLYSLNPIYKPYNVAISGIKEVWRFVNYISSEIPYAPDTDDILNQKLHDLTNEVESIKRQLNLGDV